MNIPVHIYIKLVKYVIYVGCNNQQMQSVNIICVDN